MTDADTVRVLIADEHALFRDAMRVVFTAQDDLVVVAEARDGVQAVLETERTKPDVALLDAGLANCDGIRAVAQIAESVPDCRVIVLSGHEDETMLLDALEAGASGYLSKESPLTEVITATRAVHRGEVLVPPPMLGAVLRRLIQRRRERDDVLRRMNRLTRREREVLAGLSRGEDNDAIAQRLVISPETARTHIQNLLNKLGAHSRLEAAAFVIQNGLMNELVEAQP
jgi:DNA-binding NarL/FixJ family response regulator